MSDVHISIASIAEHAALNQLYLGWGYHGGVANADRVYVARVAGHPVGLVRRASESGVVVLRGMYVAPSHQRQGVGSQLLCAFVADALAGDCYCIPFAHLTAFYSRGGFVAIPETETGDLLRERLLHYRAEGHNVLLMRRTASPDLDRAS